MVVVDFQLEQIDNQVTVKTFTATTSRLDSRSSEFEVLLDYRVNLRLPSFLGCRVELPSVRPQDRMTLLPVGKTR